MKYKKIALFSIIISSIFFINNALALTCPTGFTKESGVCIPSNTGLPDPGTSDPVASVIQNVMNWLLIVVGAIGVIAFVISGLQYLLSAGDQNTIETAKRNMQWSIVGVVVALVGVIILNFVFEMLS